MIVFGLVGPRTRVQRLLNGTSWLKVGCRGWTKPAARRFDTHQDTGN